MTLTLTILTAIIILLMFGAGQKILDNLRLNDKQAIIILIAIAIGIAIPPIYIGDYFAVSIGGYIIPFALCIYMLISCGFSRDLLRAIIGTLLVAGIIYALDWLLPSNTAEDIVVDNTFVYGLVAGVVAYILGRSRRNAFICAVFGISLAQIIQWIINFYMDTPTILGLGVGGAFSTYVIAILISVGLAEFLGRAFTNAKPDSQEKEFNFDTHTYDSETNGRLNKENSRQLAPTKQAVTKQIEKKQKQAVGIKTKSINAKTNNTATSKGKTNKAKTIARSLVLFVLAVATFVMFMPNNINSTALATEEAKTYYTVYDYSNKDKVVLIKGGEVENGDLYLSGDNKLYQITNVDNVSKKAYAKYIKDEQLPEYNVTSVYNTEVAKASSKKYVGMYHTHNDECYFTPDGTDSVYGEGGIHDVGAKLKQNLNTLGITVEYSQNLHLPHNSGAYTRSQVTAKALLNKGVDAIFDIHRDSTPRKEYLTTVNGTQMSKVRMVIGSANQNYEENKNFAYSIKSYADKVYPGLIKDIYMGGGNYNQQLTGLAMLFEMGCENIEKDLVLKSCEPLSKTIDIVLYGSNNASTATLQDVSLDNGSGTVSVIAGLSNTDSGASLSSLWVVLITLGIALAIVGISCIFSKQARYKVGRFFSEMFAGMFGKKKAKR